MTDLKSVNIVPWGGVILALFLLGIGIEELLFISDSLVDYQYIPGISFFALGGVMFAIALLTYWTGDKLYGTFFLWIAAVAPIVAMLVGFDSAFFQSIIPIPLSLGMFLGSRGLTYGIIIALFSFILAAWAFYQRKNNVEMTILFALFGLFVLFEGITNNYIELVPIESYLDQNYIFGDLFRPMKFVAGIFAILVSAAVVYFAFIKPEFLDRERKTLSTKDPSLMSFDINAIGTVIMALAMFLIAVNGILYAKEGFEYQIMPGFFLLNMGFILFFIALLAYWRANKESGMLYIWMSVFIILMGFITGMDNAFIDQFTEILGSLGGMPFFVVDKGLALGIVFGVFTLIMAVWAFFEKKAGLHVSIFLVLAAIAAILVGVSTTCFEVTELPFESLTIRIVSALGPNFVPLRVAAGIISLLASILAIYELFKFEALGNGVNSKPEELKTFDPTGINFFVVAACLVMAGVGGIAMFEGMADFQKYFISAKLFFFIAFAFASAFILLSFWNGNRITTVFMMVIAMFCLKMVMASMGYKYGVVSSIVLFLFIVAAIAWMYAKCEKPVLICVFFGLLALASLIFIIGNICFNKGEVMCGNLEGVASVILIISGAVLAYIGFAKMDALKLPVA